MRLIHRVLTYFWISVYTYLLQLYPPPSVKRTSVVPSCWWPKLLFGPRVFDGAGAFCGLSAPQMQKSLPVSGWA